MALPLTGGCGCGAVRFDISEPLAAAAYCHCTRCQSRTGTAAAATAILEPGSFRLLEGEEQLEGWHPGGMEKVFCRECGSHVFARDADSHEVKMVRLGAIDGDPGIRPQVRQFVAYAVSWEPIPDDGLPRFDERMPLP